MVEKFTKAILEMQASDQKLLARVQSQLGENTKGNVGLGVKVFDRGFQAAIASQHCDHLLLPGDQRGDQSHLRVFGCVVITIQNILNNSHNI